MGPGVPDPIVNDPILVLNVFCPTSMKKGVQLQSAGEMAKNLLLTLGGGLLGYSCFCGTFLKLIGAHSQPDWVADEPVILWLISEKKIRVDR